MDRPARPRRSSILREAAQREGYDVSLDKSTLLELAKAIPASVVSNAARLSGSTLLGRRSSAASSIGGATSEIMPTPVNRKMPPGFGAANSTSRKGSSIPRPLPSKGKRQQPAPAAHFGGGGASAGRSRVEAFLESTASKSGRRSRSHNRDDTRSTFSARMARASSMDSLSSTCMQTPAPLTPSTRFLASSSKVTFLEKTDVPKTLKPPHHKDSQALAALANIVREFMAEHQCPERLMLDPARKMSVSQFLDACRFVLQCLFGSNFLQNLKQDELTTQLVNVSGDLKYPGNLTKSVLKSPNSDHAWPAALTFLAYLCTRVDAMLTPIETLSDDPMNEIKDPAAYSKVILVESYRNLFCQAISGNDVRFEEELDLYRERLREMSNKTSNIQEVKAQLQELETELERRSAEEDPRKELLEQAEAQNATIENLNQNEAALTQKLNKYQDLEAVEARHCTLVGSFASAQAENEELDRILAAQVVDPEKRKELVKEIESFKQQREVIEQVNDRTRRFLKNREEFMANAQQRFYEVCHRLNVSNVFNENLQKLELLKEVENMERMKNNPFDLGTFKAWLKSTRRVHRHTKSLMAELQERIEDSIKKAESRIQRFAESEAAHEDVCRDLKLQAESVKAIEDKSGNELEEMTRLKSELAKIDQEINQVATYEAEAGQRLTELKKKWEGLNQDLGALNSEEAEEKVRRLLDATEKLGGPISATFHKLMLEHLAKRRAVIEQQWNIDICNENEGE